MLCMPYISLRLLFSHSNAGEPHLGLLAQDVGVTWVEDNHGAATEELSTRRPEFDLDKS